jgi:uncharacterized membrane protein
MAEPRSINWLKWGLVASLAVNLGFAGMMAGALIKGPSHGRSPGVALLHYARALPEPYQDDLRRQMREHRGEWAETREALRGQRAALAVALAAEPYAPEAVAAIFEREVRLSGELSTRGAELLLAQIARMSPDERAAYAQALREERHGHKGRRH